MIKSQRGQGTIIVIIIVAIVIGGCLLLASQPCFWGAASCSSTGATTINTSIPMIKPQGFPQRDSQNADTNIKNSKADENESIARKNDAESQSILKSIDAQNTKTAAEACDIRGDCAVFTYKEGQSAGIGLGIVGVILTVVIALLLLAAYAGKK